MAALGTLLTAMVTPFDDAGRVDEERAVALMHHLIDHGSDGLVMCATTGEGSTLSDEEHLGMIALAVGELRDRATVIASTGSNDTRHAVALTERATELGADGVLSVTPYYNRPNRRGIRAHFTAVASATDKPVMLYNIPSRTATDISADLLAELGQIEHIDAVKQANGAGLRLIDGLDLYAGDDPLLCPVLDLGGAGGVCVSSHIVGDRMRAVVDEPDAGRRARLTAELEPVYAALFVTTNPIGVKAALNLLGLPVGGLRLPMVTADEHELGVIRTMLERQGLLEGAAARAS
jgi:4-hydroxy-tetrahydrodipicolinate synthase